MLSIRAQTLNLKGTNYEVGHHLGKLVLNNPVLKAKYIKDMPNLNEIDIEESNALFDRWCPGLTEELAGFADAIKVDLKKVYFYEMTCLIPSCSHIAISPKITTDKKPILARNYEFLHELEDFCLMKTTIKGKYTHIGTSMLQFGRDDGFNEYGLAVTISSCGMPIANYPHMEKPKIKGLHYWVVVRALLENCKDVEGALKYLKDMPIAFNMNMLLLDKEGNMALFQTWNGKQSFKYINSTDDEAMIHATNHSVLPDLMQLESQVLVHSILRYEYIQKQLVHEQGITKNNLKNMLLSNYPDGLCFHHFKEGFGTTKSMLLSPVDGTIEVCWGGSIKNTWRKYDITKDFIDEEYDIILQDEKMPQDFFKFQAR